MPKPNWILLLLTLMTSSLMAQQHCSSDEMMEKFMATHPEYAEEVARFDLERAQLSKSASSRAVVTIPVVVHVIHGGESVGSGSNVSLSRIQSQIDILNEDFQRMNADASNTPGTYQGVAANAEIRFGLAIIDPSGNSTSGITRHQYNNISSTDYIENTIKPATNWDPLRYLNVWTVNLPSSTIIGYSYLPTNTMVGSDRDGLVVTHEKFGFINASNRGRTATHEIGHFLGLRHMWGRNDGSGNPIGCGSDDDVDDTPNQDAPYYGCPNSGSSCSTNDMFMNFMDYTDDYCMNLFTQGQANVMNSILNGIRADLISGNLTGNDGECVNLAGSNYNFGFEPSQSNSSWSVVNANGDDRSWLITDQSDTDWGPNTGSGMAVYFWNQDAVTAADDYLFTPCLDLKAGHEYRLTFSMAAAQDMTSFYPEKLEVGFSANQSVNDFYVPSDSWVFDPVNTIYPDYEKQDLYFTTNSNQDITIGFHVFSEPDQYAMLIDDIKIADLGSVGTKDIPTITGGVKTFPNPTDGLTTLTLDKDIWNGKVAVRLFNSLGLLVMTEELGVAEDQLTLDMGSIAAGVYFCEIKTAEKRTVERILKQ